MKSLESKGRKTGEGAVRGRLRQRDEELLIALGMARFLTTEQLNRIFRPGLDTDYLARRLRSLADAGTRSAFPGQPLLERLDYTRLDRTQAHLWSLTARGAAYVEERSGNVPYFSREVDQRIAWCDHVASLNEVFVSVVSPLRQAGFALDKLPFRWRAPGTVRIDWEEFAPHGVEPVRRALSPSAVIEFPAQKLRIFVENDASAHVQNDPVLGVPNRLNRYDRVLGTASELKARRTHYDRHFPDGFRPQLFLLGRTAARQMAIRKAVADWSRANMLSAVDVHVRSAEELARNLLEFLQRAGSLTAEASREPTPEELTQDVSAYLAYSMRLMGELCGKLKAAPPAPFLDSKERAERALRRLAEVCGRQGRTGPARKEPA
jgi:hypothetical protein